MRTIDQLSKEIKDEEVVHGPNSEIVGKLKSLLGLAWLDEDLDTGINVRGFRFVLVLFIF